MELNSSNLLQSQEDETSPTEESLYDLDYIVKRPPDQDEDDDDDDDDDEDEYFDSDDDDDYIFVTVNTLKNISADVSGRNQ